MPKSLKLYVASVVVIGAIALVVATFVFPAKPAIAIRASGRRRRRPTLEIAARHRRSGSLLTLIGVRLPGPAAHGARNRPSQSPRSWRRMFLGGPAVGGWVAAIGTTEVRELRGRIPWYGTLANHAGLVIPAVVGWRRPRGDCLAIGAGACRRDFAQRMVAAAASSSLLNLALVSILLGAPNRAVAS